MDHLTRARERLLHAEAELERLDPEWVRGGTASILEKELFDHLFEVSPTIRKAIVEVLAARRDDYSAIRHGFVRPRPPHDSAHEDIYEWLLQVLDRALLHVGNGQVLPERKSWDEFLPNWYPDVTGTR